MKFSSKYLYLILLNKNIWGYHALFFIFVMSSLAIFNSNSQNIEKMAKTFGHLPEISDAQISPDGDKIVFLQNYQGKTILVSKSLSDTSVPPVGVPYPGGKIDWVK